MGLSKVALWLVKPMMSVVTMYLPAKERTALAVHIIKMV